MDEDILALTRRLVEKLYERKAENIVAIDVSRLTVMFDCFVIATARNSVHINAIVDQLDQWRTEGDGPRAESREGDPKSGWVLADFGRIVLHLFLPDTRKYYKLEKLWGDGVPIRFPAADPEA